MQDEIVRAMMDPKTYDEEVKNIELIQTHHSFVFLTGKYAYKIKKPVNLGFLDFTTLEKRKETLEKEIKLNSRLCREIYIKILPINKLDEKIKINGNGKTIEYALKMKEFPQDKLLANLIRQGKVDKNIVERIAKIISDFHAKAETSKEINKFGSLETIKFNWMENFDQTEQFKNSIIPLNHYYFTRQKVLKFLQANSVLFERRISEGKIRDCHGDLRPTSVFVTNGICIFDCVEFNDRFRYSDVASEVAFFAMDLDFFGLRDLSKHFVEKYIEFTGDTNLLKMLQFYKCYRAYIRGKVHSMASTDPNVNEKEKQEEIVSAKKYFTLAYEYANGL